jgi:hypothetical protein
VTPREAAAISQVRRCSRTCLQETGAPKTREGLAPALDREFARTICGRVDGRHRRLPPRARPSESIQGSDRRYPASAEGGFDDVPRLTPATTRASIFGSTGFTR